MRTALLTLCLLLPGMAMAGELVDGFRKALLNDPTYLAAVEQIRDGALANNKPYGSGVYDEESARRAIANRETILLSLGDVNVLANGANRLAVDLRAAIADTR